MKETFESFETGQPEGMATPLVDLASEFRCPAQQDLASQANPPRGSTPVAEAQPPRVASQATTPLQEPEGFEPTFRSELQSRFFNSPKPSHWLKFEKPYHRMMAMLSAEGHTIVEIAQMTGFTTTCVSNVLRQPWMQSIILEHIATHSDRVMLEIRAECMASKRVIAELRDTAESEPVRLKAAQDFLDRTYGKPNQPMSVTQKPASELSDDELAKLATQGN